MRTVRYKLYFAWDYEKEELWLNSMSERGYQLVQPGFGRYVFEENATKRDQYKLELLEQWPTHGQSRDYIRFLEETGVEYVGSVMRWAYFRKPVSEGEFELYSDLESRIAHYKRMILILAAVTPINVINLINMGGRYLSENSTMDQSSTGIIVVILSVLVLLLGIGIFRIYSEMAKLKKEQQIRE